MKIALKTLALAAILPLIVSVAVSCNKEPDPSKDKSGSMPVLEETKYDKFVTAGVVADYVATSSRKLVSYDFGGNGTATLGFVDVMETKVITKAEETVSDVYYELYPYKVEDGEGNVRYYIVEGFGTLMIEFVEDPSSEVPAIVTIIEDGAETIKDVPAYIPEKVEETTFSKNICRDWKVRELFIEGSGGDLKQTVGRRFTGCDLNEMMAYLKEKGVDIDSDALNYQMNVNLIKISEYGEITISFGETTVADYKEYPVHKPYTVKVNPQYLKEAEQNLGNIIQGMLVGITFKPGSSATLTVAADKTAQLKASAAVQDWDGNEYAFAIEAVLTTESR